MKKRILSLLLIYSGALFAQNFTIIPSTVITSNQSLNTYADYTFYIKNNKGTALNMSWDLIGDNFLSGWDYSICDYGTCYLTPFPSTASMAPISVGDTGFMKITLGTLAFSGNGVFKVFVYETGNKPGGDTLVWDITAGTTGLSSVFGTKGGVVFHPNPVAEKAYVTFDDVSTEKKVYIYSIAGAVVKTMILDVGISNAELDLRDLSTGTYFLSYSVNHTTYVKKFVKE